MYNTNTQFKFRNFFFSKKKKIKITPTFQVSRIYPYEETVMYQVSVDCNFAL